MNTPKLARVALLVAVAVFHAQGCSAASDAGRGQGAGDSDPERALVRAMVAEDWDAAYRIAISIEERGPIRDEQVMVEVANAILNGGHPEAAIRLYERAHAESAKSGYYTESRTPDASTVSYDMAGLAMLESLRGMAVSNHLLGRHVEACRNLIELSERVKDDWVAHYWRAQSALAGHPCAPEDAVDKLMREAETVWQPPTFGPRLLAFRKDRADQ